MSDVAVSDPAEEPKMTCVKRVTNFIENRWFELGMVLMILCAFAYPPFAMKGGIIKPEITIKYVAISITFLLSGISLKTQEIIKAVAYCKVHVLVHSMIFVVAPVLLFLVAALLRYSSISPLLIDGLIVCGCMPTTVSMANILTEASGGALAISLFNTAAANLLGVVVTPALLLLLLSENSGSGNVLKVLQQLGLTLILPLVIGQLIHIIVGPTRLKPCSKAFGRINKLILLLIILATFSDTFSSDVQVDGGSMVAIILVVVVLYCTMLSLCVCLFQLRCLNLEKKYQVAAWFCGSQKTIAAGIPLINIIYANNPYVGIISIPLLIWHPTQLIVRGMLLTRITNYVKEDEEPVMDDIEQVPLSERDATTEKVFQALETQNKGQPPKRGRRNTGS